MKNLRLKCRSSVYMVYVIKYPVVCGYVINNLLCSAFSPFASNREMQTLKRVCLRLYHVRTFCDCNF